MKKAIIILLVSYLGLFDAKAQDYEPEVLESIFEQISKDSETSPQLDELEYLIAHKLNLNESKAEDLMRLPGISYVLAEKIIGFVKKYPDCNFRMMSDSLEITPEQAIILNLCTNIKIVQKNYGFSSRLRNEHQLNKIYGFEEGVFQGSRLDLYQKYQAFYKSSSVSLIMSKRRGEIKLTDFTGGYLRSEIAGYKFILGDYYSSVGFGGILWKGLGSRKGADVISPAVQYGSGIMPNNSSIENSFFRGLAVSKNFVISEFSQLKAQMQFALSPRSGSLDSTGRISSLYPSGLFRTQDEISKRNTFTEKSCGTVLEYSLTNLKIGANAIYLGYNKSLSADTGAGLMKKTGILSSLYGYYNFSEVTIGGEVSRDALNNFGATGGLQYETPKFSAALNIRSFGTDFNSPYGYMFGESYNPINQTGLYIGLNYRQSEKLEFAAYLDIYKSLKPIANSLYPVKGTDYFMQTKCSFSEYYILTFRVQYENKTDNMLDAELNKRLIFQKSGTSLRLDFLQRFPENISTRFRLESCFKSFENLRNSESGYSAFCEINWEILSFLKTGCRFSYFSTQSYETAIWEFEGVVPGLMPTRVLYGDGIKFIAFAGFHPIKEISFWIVWQYFEKYNTQSLGTGYNVILNNNDRKLLFQLEAAFYSE